ncbi:pseudouridine synthase [Lysobacter sp. SG-8]|uniref:Pseudouridine synthase n=1 Tax=Marilutibacter penaei TaxID=2759900 RepID=A0A7W3U295_9GAMM|nr:pseudouridine synthase [Lysobacter penaei]MBB1087607.1 pseudouridine synthase [Lysobacter penaei]
MSAPFVSEDGVAASRYQLLPGRWANLLDGLCAAFPGIPRETWQARFERGRVLDANGTPLRADAPWRVGLELRYFREVEDEPRVPFEARVLYRDARLLVADKPHFLPVTPAGGHVAETLLARLRRETGLVDIAPLHRIDRETAGLVLFSLDAATRPAYAALFAGRRIHKHYEALAGPLPGIEFPHVRRSRIVRGSPFFRMQEVEGVANSATRIEVIEGPAGEGPWRYRLVPVTGRKHQLRLHMASLGAPILGDRTYPTSCPRAPGDFSAPLQLLARSLRFRDPVDGRERAFKSGFRLDGLTPTRATAG